MAEPARPLVLITRPLDRQEEARRLCARLGLMPLMAPAIETHPLQGGPRGSYRRILARQVDTVVFTSLRGVELALKGAGPRARELAEALGGLEVWAIGPPTADALRRYRVAAHLPPVHSSEGLVEAMAPAARGRRVELLRSEQGSRVLAGGLRRAGAEVHDTPLYRVGPPADPAPLREAIRRATQGEVHGYTFTSRLTAQHTLDAAGDQQGALVEAMNRGVVGAMGKPTRKMLEEAGVRVDVEPERAVFAELLQGIAERLKV